MGHKFDTALVVGGGAFGSAISAVLAENFAKVVVKVREEENYRELKKHKNDNYLPGAVLAKNIVPALTWSEVDQLAPKSKIQLHICALPSSAIFSFYHENMQRFQDYFYAGIPMVSLAKGIDPDTLELPDDLLMHFFSEHSELITYLSGPSFAREILDKQVTLVNLAGRHPDVLYQVSNFFKVDYFKVIPTYDVKGVLLGGALKNILAIASGILEGLGYNHNTRAAMITRGIQEMLSFGRVLNARSETFYTYAGMGDLILTTTGGLSRNKQFGLEIAKGRSATEIISLNSTVEGYKTTAAAYELAKKYHIKTLLFDGIYQILYQDADPTQVIRRLMAVPVRKID